MLVLCCDKGSRSVCPAMHPAYLHQLFPKINSSCSFPAPFLKIQPKPLTNTDSSGIQTDWLSVTTHRWDMPQTGWRWHVPLSQQISAEDAAQTLCLTLLFRGIWVSSAGECRQCHLTAQASRSAVLLSSGFCMREALWVGDSGLNYPPLCQRRCELQNWFKGDLQMRLPAWFTNLSHTRVRWASYAVGWLRFTWGISG